jgi:hypothetical protein
MPEDGTIQQPLPPDDWPPNGEAELIPPPMAEPDPPPVEEFPIEDFNFEPPETEEEAMPDWFS